MIKRTIKSYVLRAGRTSHRQQAALDEGFDAYQLPGTGLWDFRAIFGNDNPVVVEIGFGMGQSLLTMAQLSPETNFIGIEVHRPGVGALVAGLRELNLTNIRIACADAVGVFEQQIPAGSVTGIQIFFPDPWPKKRHHKRRLVQHGFINTIVNALKPQGFIHCATDWEAYADHMLTVLSETSTLKNTQREGFSPRPDTRPVTKFEARGQRLGHGVWDLVFEKVI